MSVYHGPAVDFSATPTVRPATAEVTDRAALKARADALMAQHPGMNPAVAAHRALRQPAHPAVTDAPETLSDYADQLQKQQPGLSRPVAMARACRLHPDLVQSRHLDRRATP